MTVRGKTEEEIKQIKEMRKQGITCREIAEKFGISKQYVNILAKRDLASQERETIYSNLTDTFIKEYNEGHSVSEIALKYNTVASTVFRILKKNKIPINRKRRKKSTSEVTTP
ncbi:MAG: helix-turn-helix domain-containing protein [Candidatus Eremiobacterota bacterium]